MPRLDELLAGGLARGNSALLIGSAGVGESTLATQYALAAAHRGEVAAIFCSRRQCGPAAPAARGRA